MKIVIATGNAHKVREIARILPQFSFITPADIGVSFSYSERGKSFMANALGKAYHCAERIGAQFPVIADDSGICVDALRGRPGIHSARFGRGRGIGKGDDLARNMLLLRLLRSAPDRRAHYVCAVVCVRAPHRTYAIEERWDGVIASAMSKGSGGFGYDPLFIPEEAARPVAELRDHEKDRYSHRAKALRLLAMHILVE